MANGSIFIGRSCRNGASYFAGDLDIHLRDKIMAKLTENWMFQLFGALAFIAACNALVISMTVGW